MIQIPPIVFKAIGLVAMVAIIFGIGFLKGQSYVQDKWDAAVGRQATQSASQIIAEATKAAHAETQYIEVKGKTETKLKIVKVKEVQYVQSTAEKCVVDDEFVRVWDDISGVYGTSRDSLSSSDATSPRSDGLPWAPVTTAEVIRAYHSAVAELVRYRDAYNALEQYEQGSYIVRKAAHGGTQ